MYIFLSIIPLFLLISCGHFKTNKWTKDKEQAINDARAVVAPRRAYLQCYALKREAKNECTKQIAKQYIPEQWRSNFEYTRAFQFESERLGFVSFLEAQSFLCGEIKNGPKFIDSANAYLVVCNNGHNYFMRFNYLNERWSVVIP